MECRGQQSLLSCGQALLYCRPEQLLFHVQCAFLWKMSPEVARLEQLPAQLTWQLFIHYRITPPSPMAPASSKGGNLLPQAAGGLGAKPGHHMNGKLHSTVNGKLAMNPSHRNTQIRCLCDVNVDRGHMIQCEVRHACCSCACAPA